MPVLIGALTDTPAPGDPIVSPWYQEIATYARHIFTTKAALDAAWADAPNGAHAYTTTDNVEWVRVGGSWVPQPAWTAYPCTWTAGGAATGIGNGTLTARSARVGNVCHVRIALVFGATTNGGSGPFTFSLPYVSGGAGEQELTVKATVSSGAVYAGVAPIGAGQGFCTPHAPADNTVSNLFAVQNAAVGGQPGTGVPLVGGAYTFVGGSTLQIQGAYEVA